MSQVPTSAPRQHSTEQQPRELVLTDDEEVQEVLDVLDDDACRDILDATDDEPLSANEVSDACDLPLSTTYRKLERLTDAGLLDERVRIRRSGRHLSEYVRLLEDVVISLDADGAVELQVSKRAAANPYASPAPNARN
ncbi:helix-turn-helix domain-containing protein [Halobaculum sp. D14]|uniref:helix-turn-helix domain-containing protein n=1 Tax=unclassified Halobaculum TaxID=2640896 RepID=UPI003EB97E47